RDADMKLRDLEAEFVSIAAHGEETSFALADSHGVVFLCPKCYAERGSAVGVHSVLCWFKGRVPDDRTPGPGRWTPSGGGIDDLTLTPSVHLTGGGCGWHGFVTNGEAQ